MRHILYYVKCRRGHLIFAKVRCAGNFEGLTDALKSVYFIAIVDYFFKFSSITVSLMFKY